MPPKRARRKKPEPRPAATPDPPTEISDDEDLRLSQEESKVLFESDDENVVCVVAVVCSIIHSTSKTFEVEQSLSLVIICYCYIIQ